MGRKNSCAQIPRMALPMLELLQGMSTAGSRRYGEAPMFPLSHMLKSFVRIGTLKVIDAGGRPHVFAGAPGPSVTMLLTDRSLYRKLFLNPELHAGEAYMDNRMLFLDST